MRVLVACEFSGVVREAFARLGHDAWSCDLLPTEILGKHIQDDVMNVLRHGGGDWDLILAFPPCTHLSVSGAAYWKQKQADGRQSEAVRFFEFFTYLKTKKWCVENPVGIMSSLYRKPDQIIHPYQFGHPEQKTTCLWLKNLPKLIPTNNVKEQMLKLPKNKRERLHYLSPGKERWKERSRTFTGIAQAMAEQWGK